MDTEALIALAVAAVRDLEAKLAAAPIKTVATTSAALAGTPGTKRERRRNERAEELQALGVRFGETNSALAAAREALRRIATRYPYTTDNVLPCRPEDCPCAGCIARAALASTPTAPVPDPVAVVRRDMANQAGAMLRDRAAELEREADELLREEAGEEADLCRHIASELSKASAAVYRLGDPPRPDEPSEVDDDIGF